MHPAIGTIDGKQIAGAQIQQNTGAPGGGNRIRLRGTSSILANATPLYVVDGVITSDVAIDPGTNKVTRASGAAITAPGQESPVNRIADLNPDDIEKRNLKTGQVVDLTSHFHDGERHAYRFIVVPYPIPRGCAAAYFPEANPLVPLGSVAEKSDTPASKSVIVSIQPRNEFAGDFKYDYMKASRT